MGYTVGQKITLQKAKLYASSDATKAANTVSGTYYIWSGTIIRNRIRITNRSEYAGKSPAGTYVTGWIDESSIPEASTTTASSTTTATTAGATSAATVQTTVGKGTEFSAEDLTGIPGRIGNLGNVVFVVSESQIKVIESFTWSSTARYVSHQRHLNRDRVEFTGVDADEISFTFRLSAYLGAKPLEDYVTLLTYQRNGTAVPFKLGNKTYGFYRWVITSLSYTGEYSDQDGDWTQAKVQVSMKGYEA